MVTMGVFPFQGKTHMVEPGIEPGTSWLVVSSSDHQATRLVWIDKNLGTVFVVRKLISPLRDGVIPRYNVQFSFRRGLYK